MRPRNVVDLFPVFVIILSVSVGVMFNKTTVPVLYLSVRISLIIKIVL